MQESVSEAIILISPVRRVGKDGGEMLYCAGVTPEGEWVRLYVSPFDDTEDERKFSRWNRIRFHWTPSPEDARSESRVVDPKAVQLIGQLPQAQRHEFLNRLEVNGLSGLTDQGRSLALVRPRNPHFFIEHGKGGDAPRRYRFKYRYSLEEGDGEVACQGGEIQTTFDNLSQSLGEAAALAWIIKVFGKEYPERGIVFAMGTDAEDPSIWQVNGIICMDEVFHSGERLNVLC